MLRWIVVFLLVCAGVFAAVYGVMWGLGEFSNLGRHGTIAAVLGTFVTTVIGVALMALTFYSNRSGHDSTVYQLEEDDSQSPEDSKRG
jgi:hypothetical protein